MNETRRGILMGGLCGIANWITGRAIAKETRAADAPVSIEAVNFDAYGKITPLARQPELFARLPPRDWGCFKSIAWTSIADKPPHGETILIFGGNGPSLVQVFHQEHGGPVYRGVNCKYGPMEGILAFPDITHWANPEWPEYALPEPKIYFPFTIDYDEWTIRPTV